MEKAFRAAVENIARHGDTDVFPFPIETHLFFDEGDKTVSLLENIHKDLDKALKEYPPVNEGMLVAVGYTGFRWATQIDPIWNAYFLGLVIELGPEIEGARLSKSKDTVFSYRFKWDEAEKTMFDKEYGWAQFQRTSVERAKHAKYVLVCDIADFYQRIYHHRLENAIQKVGKGSDICSRIMKLLMKFSNNVSFGLPVGGPAARLLSELLLNRVDRLLAAHDVTFCRFVDDYHIFADSEEQAYRHLVFLSEKLLDNEGLLLQKSKTRIMSSDEFVANSEFEAVNEPEGAAEQQGREFLRLHLHYDPYSATAPADYESLKAKMGRFNLIGMLGREIRKSRVHLALTRKLIAAIRFLEEKDRDAAVVSLVDNLEVLYPVFPSIMLLLKSVLEELGADSRDLILQRIRDLIRNGSYIIQVPTHLAFSLRILAQDPSEEAEELLVKIYGRSSSSLIRRDVILAMAKRNADFWISDTRTKFRTLTEWEKTALLVVSYILGDEGKHWRSTLAGSLTPMQDLVRDWAAKRANAGNKGIPI